MKVTSTVVEPGVFAVIAARPLTGKKIVVTRARENASILSQKLKDLGAEVVEMPCIRTQPLTQGNKALCQVISHIDDFRWLVFSSSTGVNVFFDYLQECNADIRTLQHLRIAVVGAETEKELAKRGLLAAYVPETYSGQALAEGLVRLRTEKEDEPFMPFTLRSDSADRCPEKVGKVLIVGASGGAEDMTRIFEKNNIDFENIAIYKTGYVEDESEDKERQNCNDDFDLVTFTSSSTVEGFVRRNRGINFKELKAVCIGEKTESAAARHGMKTVVSRQATIESMIEKIQEEA